MVLINQIAIRSANRAKGEQFDHVRIWVCGMAFHADLHSTAEERVLRRIAAQVGVEVDDYRKAGAE